MQNTAALQAPASSAPKEPTGPGTASSARRRALRGGAIVALAVLLLVAAAVVVYVTTRQAPPATGAAAVVPGDALAYVNLSTDLRRAGVKRAARLATRLPGYGSALARLEAIVGGGAGVDFTRDVRPWLGKEAAFALLDTSSATAGSLILLEVRHRARAQAFLSRVGAQPDGTYGRTALYRYRTGTELAFVRRYLALGQPASVRASLDVAAGRSPSLHSSRAYRAAAAGEPNNRVLDAYLPAVGVRRVLGSRTGALGALGLLLDQPALTGTTISISAVSGGARIRIHSALDPTLKRVSGERAGSFAPTLQGVLPSGSMMLIDVKGIARAAPRLLAAASTMGIASRVAPLLSRLGAALGTEGVNVPSIVSLFGGETAVAMVPTSGAPSLVVVSRTRNQPAALGELAAVQAPLTQLFPIPSDGPGQAPEFNDRPVGGITAHQLSLGPDLQVDYAVFHGLIVVSTSLEAIAEILHHRRSLAGDHGFRSALGDRPDHITSLVFLDFSQLLSLGEQTGLVRSGQLTALRQDLDSVHAIGLSSTSGESDTTAELFLHIS
jgi:hypothetical protein